MLDVNFFSRYLLLDLGGFLVNGYFIFNSLLWTEFLVGSYILKLYFYLSIIVSKYMIKSLS